MFNFRIISIARKEFLHILHDPRTLLIIFAMPVIQLVMFGYALNLEIQRVDLAVVDYARSPASERLVDQFRGSRFFEVFPYRGSLDQVEALFLERRARVVLIIPADFGEQLSRNPLTPVQILIDAVDPNAAVSIQRYCDQVIRRFNQQYGSRVPLPFRVEPTIWYNPDLKSSHFFVPGILALLLMMIAALLTSITITREKEMGTLEQILVSPIRPHEVIIGKVLPYILLAFLDGALILSIGVFLFQVPFVGSLGLLALLTTLYLITALSLGLMISTLVDTQQVAMMLAMISTLLPTIILSGFIFPIPSMPRILQYISYLIPARYFLVIVRGIMLKGNSFGQLIGPTAFLALTASVLLFIAWRKFRLNLER
ncbi:MAG: ABC transporter permease [Calditrichaeota bacterium]|nr:MAG: ABC transporter permease [Calditrichota bacterium]